MVKEGEIVVCIEISAYKHILAVITAERRFNKGFFPALAQKLFQDFISSFQR